jgi:hypothetical protein
MTDLKSFLLENLENSGKLDEIKSELKNNLFTTLRDDQSSKPLSLQGDKEELAAELVRDFFETFCMQYSLSVFIPESKLPERSYQRESIEKKLNLKGNEELPLLSSFVSSLKSSQEPSSMAAESMASFNSGTQNL